MGYHPGVGCRTGWLVQVLPVLDNAGRGWLAANSESPKEGLQQGAGGDGKGWAEAPGCTDPGLTCFLHVVYILPSCLHSQEVEEDPQGAGEAPKVWLTPLAADPVHFLGNHGALRDTGEHERIYGEAKGWEAG